MAPFTNGTGGTIAGVTNREDWTRAIINFIRIQQATGSKNPNSLKNLVVNENTDGALSGTFTCPVTLTSGPGGAITVTASSYLMNVNYVAPTGGDSTATNEVQALIDTVMRQKALELDTAKNSTNANHLSWSVTMGGTGLGTNNATISIGFSGLPADMTQAPNGSINIEGRTYLT